MVLLLNQEILELEQGEDNKLILNNLTKEEWVKKGNKDPGTLIVYDPVSLDGMWTVQKLDELGSKLLDMYMRLGNRRKNLQKMQKNFLNGAFLK